MVFMTAHRPNSFERALAPFVAASRLEPEQYAPLGGVMLGPEIDKSYVRNRYDLTVFVTDDERRAVSWKRAGKECTAAVFSAADDTYSLEVLRRRSITGIDTDNGKISSFYGAELYVFGQIPNGLARIVHAGADSDYSIASRMNSAKLEGALKKDGTLSRKPPTAEVVKRFRKDALSIIEHPDYYQE